LYGAESRLKRPLPEIRALLTAIPVTQAQSEDPQYLKQFAARSESEQQVMEWQLFFQQQQRKAIKALEELK
jgi:phosphoglycerate transport regulatory protein PgtC